MAEYESLLSREPDSAEALMGLGVLFEQIGHLKEAAEAYLRVLARNPQFAPAANNLAWVITRGTNPDLGEALRLAQSARDSQPGNPFINDTLGYVFYLRGAYDLATIQLRNAIAAAPHIPTIRYHLALALKAQGADREAVQELMYSLGQTADFPERDEAEKLLRSLQGTSQ
jgi:Flp pilus assembly protein TadD